MTMYRVYEELTKNCVYTYRVEAESEEEARSKIENGEAEIDDIDEDVTSSYISDIEETE